MAFLFTRAQTHDLEQQDRTCYTHVKGLGGAGHRNADHLVEQAAGRGIDAPGLVPEHERDRLLQVDP